MLSKLIKHELRATWKVPVLLVGVLMVVSLVTGISLAMLIRGMEAGWEWIGLPFSAMAMALLYYAALVAANFGVTIYQAVHFYKSTFTDEGYLTHTLPATSHQLLISKALVICLWNLVSVASVLLSLFLLGGSLMACFPEGLAGIMDTFREALRMGMARHLGGLLGSVSVMMLASLVYNATLLIGSITIGQMLRKHRVLGALGAYFGITSVVGTISMIFSMVVMFASMRVLNDAMDIFAVYTPMYLIMALVEVLVGVGLYFLSEYLIRRHLELE